MHLRHYLLKQYCKELSDLPAQLAARFTAGDTSMAADYNPLYNQGGSGLGGVSARSSNSDALEGVPVAGGQSGFGVQLDLKALMAEDESTAERRAQLRRQLKQLNGVRMILSVF